MSRRAALLTVGALLCALIGWWGTYEFLASYERDYLEARTKTSAEARRNPLLAAERFLGRLGHEARSISGRDHLLYPPAEPGLLLVSHLGPSLPREREQILLDWIRAGGHLVTTPVRAWDEQAESGGNRLLDDLGVRWLSGGDEDGERDAPWEPLEGLMREGGEITATLVHPGLAEPLEIAFTEGHLLADANEAAEWKVPADGGYHALQYRIGRGFVTVLGDMGFLSNDHIGERDHALFLALLAEQQPRVWLLYSSNMPSLFRLLWDSAPWLVAAVALACGLWLWSLTLRTGPLLPSGNRVRRSLLEHLEAAAAYGWGTDQAQAMMGRTRGLIEQEWVRRHPWLGSMDETARSEWIGARCGIAPRAVAAALHGRVTSEQDLVRSSAVQQKLVAGLGFRTGGGEVGEGQ